MRSMVSAISARGTVTTASWMSCSRRRSAPIAEPACSVPTPPGWPVPQAFKQVERLRAAHLADRNAVGPKTQRRTDEIGQRGGAVLGAQRDEVRRGALQLARILDQHDAVAGLGDLGEERVDQRGLAGRGAAGDEHVLALAHRDAQQLGLRRRHDAGVDIVVEREHGDGRAADGEARRRRPPAAPGPRTAPRFPAARPRRADCWHAPRRRHDARRGARCVRRRPA